MAEVGTSTLFKSAGYKFCPLLTKYVTVYRLPTDTVSSSMNWN